MDDKSEMMQFLGINSLDDLFKDIPEEVKIDKLNIPEGIDEQTLRTEARNILAKNKSFFDMPSFLGAGVYNHYIPAGVYAIASRSEFYTAYTPYQPEISQGMLQTLFEYQSYIAELTGLDAANASMYDHSTALGEAARMAHSINEKMEILIPKNLQWQKKSVLWNYIKGLGMKIIEYDYDKKTGKIDLEDLKNKINNNTAAVYAENPNFFGVIDENVLKIRELGKFIFIAGINPISLGILKSPGDYGADIAIGEGQIIGNPMNFGGPLLGIFATKMEYVRKMPGRIIGMSKDKNGKRAFVMTLQTREQHIRRARATSNICSNEALCAVFSASYLSFLGKSGLRRLAEINMQRANDVREKILSINGFKNAHESLHFNEFAIILPKSEIDIHKHLLSRNVHGGYLLNTWNKNAFPELGNAMLFNVTEVHSDKDVEKLLNALKEVQ
ncbi:MAG: aminomethyl-transferring glycine dehydrogenase subunit GcvPA [Thermoplasmata archaeon]|nr:aminomethyl-transferring glycine dehydrogenase subunit GcvPA [Thermoplasmata archaeon]